MHLLKRNSVSSFLFHHSRFCIIWFDCIIFYRDHIYFIECFIVIYYSMQFYSIILLFYGFLKWRMIRVNGVTAISCFIFVTRKFGDCIYLNFLVFLEWVIWVIEGLLRLHCTEWVKLKNNGPPFIKTDIERIECQTIFPENI